jgi:hypothetical protein
MADYNDIRYNVGYTKAGNLVFIKKLTASSSSTLSFVDGTSDVVLDGTYDEYLFVFNNIHASTQAHLQVNFSADSGSNYNVTKQSSFFFSSHDEADTSTSLSYQDYDLALSANAQPLALSCSSDNDAGGAGYLHLFAPSDTTFIKHFISVAGAFTDGDYYNTSYVSGYCNTTSAVDAVQFSMASGNIDAGTISLYGLGS